MDTFTVVWLLLCSPIVIGTAVSGLVWPPRRRSRLVGDFVTGRALVLDPGSAALAERLLVAGRRGRFVGALLGATLGLVAFTTLADDSSSRNALFLGALVAVYVSTQLAGVVGTVLAVRRAAPEEPGGERLAHLPSPSVADFLPPVMRWWSAAVLGASTLAIGLHLAAGADGPGPGPRTLIIGWVVGAAGVVATEVAARLVARAPRPATSLADLAVRDEIAGDLVVVVVAGAMGPAIVCAYVAEAMVPVAGGLGALLVVVPAALEHRRRRRVRERLWAPSPSPALAPDTAP
jgi:hypothetical protein